MHIIFWYRYEQPIYIDAVSFIISASHNNIVNKFLVDRTMTHTLSSTFISFVLQITGDSVNLCLTEEIYICKTWCYCREQFFTTLFWPTIGCDYVAVVNVQLSSRILIHLRVTQTDTQPLFSCDFMLLHIIIDIQSSSLFEESCQVKPTYIYVKDIEGHRNMKKYTLSF